MKRIIEKKLELIDTEIDGLYQNINGLQKTVDKCIVQRNVLAELLEIAEEEEQRKHDSLDAVKERICKNAE